MHFFSFLLLSILLVVNQTTMVHYLPDYLGRPDFIYILIAFFAYKFSWGKGCLLTFITGWMIDVLSSQFLGGYIVECLFVFICLKIITQNNPVKEYAYQIPLIGISYLFMQLILFLCSRVLLGDTGPVWSWLQLAKETVEIVFVAIPCFLLFNKLHEVVESYKVTSRIMRKPPSNRYK
jgi:rod shape-determining protein MreD